jgi:predicted enzyme related to lactoylglutathione lyase
MVRSMDMVRATTLYPFVPSGANFSRAIDFFIALGFTKEWEHDGLAALRFGGAFFLLQNIDIPQWQSNQMINFEVDNLDAYWSEIEAKDLPASFGGVRLGPPKDFPWGREIHIIDPAGVCWHVRQSAA